MRSLSAAIGGLFLVLAFLPAQPARAQTRYNPQLPAISPWLNLYDRRSGPLGGYLSGAQPRMQLNRTLNQQQTTIDRQRNEIQSLGQQLGTVEQEGAGAPTGVGGTFMNLSHYYRNSARGNRPATASGTPACACRPVARAPECPPAGCRSAECPPFDSPEPALRAWAMHAGAGLRSTPRALRGRGLGLLMLGFGLAVTAREEAGEALLHAIPPA